MRLGIVIVHYRTPELAAECVAALRADSPGSQARIVLVDNGSDEAGRRLLHELGGVGVEVLEPGENLGFAGGVNRGVAACLESASPHDPIDALAILNPDVLVRPGCLAGLLSELDRGAAVAGPAFFWDRGELLRLPPTERRTRRDELRAAAARGGAARAARARRHWREHAREHWLAKEPISTPWLSGGLLAFRREAWETVGPFDEGYRLYFEETDWLMRLTERGLASRLVPSARAVHLYAQSALREPAAQLWFEESAERFRHRWYGISFSRLLASQTPRSAEPEPLPTLSAEGIDLDDLCARRKDGGAIWIEVSPTYQGFPAAAERIETPSGRWCLPAEVTERLPAAPWSALASDDEGRELGRWAISPGVEA